MGISYLIYCFKRFFTLVCLTIAITVMAFGPTGYENKSWAQDDSIPNEYIFQVLLLPDWRISEAIFAYEQNGKYYLPIGELAENFEFFAEVEPEEKLIIGHASREENTFTIDGARNEIIVNGERDTITDDATLTSDFLATDDLYVQIEVINQIWPVDLNIELSSLTIFVEAEEELSFMRDKIREDKREQILTRKELQEQKKVLLPRRDNPYQTLGKPVIDYQAIYQFDTEEDNLIGSNIFSGVQQIGKAIADFSANFRLAEGEIERPDSIRLRLSRQSAGDEYLFPGVRKIEGGDVTLRQQNLIANSTTGRGISISNDNSNRESAFDLITIEGTGPPGWDIELFNNEELIEFSIVPDNGQFFFEDVVLNFGNNEIKLLFFGPQGQVREELRSYNAGGNMLSPGKLQYNAGILDSDRDFILLDNSPRTDPRGVVKTANASYGVNRWLTVFGDYTEIPNNDKDRNYATVGAGVSTPIGLLETQAYKQIGGGKAYDFGYVTRFLGVRANLGTSIFKNFESDIAGFGTSRKKFEARGQLNKSVKLFSYPLGLRFNTLHTERVNGSKTTDLDFAQTFSRAGWRLSHSTNTRLNDRIHERTTGGLSATVREGPWQLRGSFNYEAHPESKLSSGNAELRYRAENSFQSALNVSHNFESSDYRVGLQTGYDFNKFLGAAETSYERNQGWDFILRATTSLHPYTNDGLYDFSSKSKRDYAPVRSLVFLDQNADGILNNGEEPIEGARLKLGNARTKTKTDEDGYIIANAPADKLINIALDTPSLEDPYYIPAVDGFSSVPIRGKMIDTVFPVVETGSIEGTIFRDSNKKTVAGLTLDLIDVESGKVAMSIESAFDGYYVFEFVRPGTYKIQTADSHVAKLHEKTANIEHGDLYVYGHDLTLDDISYTRNKSEISQHNIANIEPAAGSTSDLITDIVSNLDKLFTITNRTQL